MIEALRRYAKQLRERLGRVTLVLFGSYARGDFNQWSDIDALIVSDAFRGVRFLERWRLLPEPPAGLEALEPITWTPEEARVMLEKPSWRTALREAVVIVDDYGLFAAKRGSTHHGAQPG